MTTFMQILKLIAFGRPAAPGECRGRNQAAPDAVSREELTRLFARELGRSAA